MRKLSGEFCFDVVLGILWLIMDRDYATWTNLQDNITSNAMVCDYKMVGYL